MYRKYKTHLNVICTVCGLYTYSIFKWEKVYTSVSVIGLAINVYSVISVANVLTRLTS